MTTRTKMTIRAFQTPDVFPLKSLIHRTIAACYPGHYCTEAVRFFGNYHSEQAIFRDAQEGDTIVLDRGGRIVGTGTLLDGEIKRVFVDPAFQRRGLGFLLMQCLEAKAAASGVGIVRLDASLPAKAFYDGLGYATVEAASFEVENGRRLDFFRMEKALYVPVE